MVAAVQLSW